MTTTSGLHFYKNMAKVRMINTRFWSDNFVAALSPTDRYLFLYFLTNEHTNIAGVYELPLNTISAEVGLKPFILKKSLERLYPKIAYFDGWVCVKNFQKYQSGDNDKIRKGIEAEMSKIPLRIKDKIQESDTLSIPYTYPSVYSNPNLNSNPNPTGVETPTQVCKDFFEGGEQYSSMLDVFTKQAPRLWLEEEFKKFTLYWTEPNKSGTKTRWEQQDTFEIKRRLFTWLSRSKEFKHQPNKVKII